MKGLLNNHMNPHVKLFEFMSYIFIFPQYV